jgi:tetratricopeptide (TPR) repeat protein
VILISVIVIIIVKRLQNLFVGWFWYLITIMPVIGIVQVGKQAFADRYTYLPLIGVGVMLAWGIPLLFEQKNIGKRILFSVGTLFVSLLAFGSWQQCGYWRNSLELFSHALRVTQNNYLAHNNMGLALFAEGRIDEAIAHYNEALSIMPVVPDHALVYNNRGIAYSRFGSYQKALDDLNKAIGMKPDYADAYSNRGIVYSRLNNNRLALEDFDKAVTLKPDYAELYNNRGVAYTKLGNYEMAIDDFNKAIDLQPNYLDAFYKRSVVYLEQGKKELGCRDAQKACDLGNCTILYSAQRKGDCP